jgi:competence protein ComEC
MESQIENRAATKATVPLWTLFIPVTALALLVLATSQSGDGRLHVWVLDVGQGDAILLRTPRGHTALIDGGPAATPLLNGIGKDLPFWRHDLDLVVLTHPHQDHMMGLIELLERYRVDQVVQTEFTATVGVQAEWLRAIKKHNVPVHYARRGESITFEGEPEVALRVLSPKLPHAAFGTDGGDVNNASIVLSLTYGSHRLLLEGDAQMEAEMEMAREEGAYLNSHVLKVAHHGSDTSSTPQFVALVKPLVAIISVGSDNRFGHPAPETVQTLQQAGTRVYRTDINGTVEVIADREQMWVRSER